MKGNHNNSNQKSLLYQGLSEILNPRHPLYQLAGKITWGIFEKEFSDLYIDFGRPAKPIRLMVFLSMLKQIYDLSDEQLAGR